MPVAYIPHGGGPWSFVELSMSGPDEVARLREYLSSLPAQLGPRPRAVLVISAHWEEPVPTVMTHERPPLYFDYYGFPPAAYELLWPAPGDPALAARVRELVGAAGFSSNEDPERGFDHGTFVPLELMYPQADLPVVQLSLIKGLDPARHLALGRALAPLRDEGVLIIGSGMSYHDMRGFMTESGRAVSETFDKWLVAAATAEPDRRDALLGAWADAPAGRQAHPREEHLLPLMVIAGAAGLDQGRVGFSGTFATTRISAFEYG